MNSFVSINIFPIRMGFDTVYILKGEGTILVDGGDPGKIKTFQRGLEHARISPQEIRLILLTHGHWDHVGSTQAIQELTGATVAMHRGDLGLPGVFPPPQPPGFTTWGKLVIALIRLITRRTFIPPFEVNLILEDEGMRLTKYGIPGTVVHTPGHSTGSLSVLLDSGEAFVGDLAMNMFPLRLQPGLPIFGDDIRMIKESWRKVLAMSARTIYPAHGKPFPAQVMRQAIA